LAKGAIYGLANNTVGRNFAGGIQEQGHLVYYLNSPDHTLNYWLQHHLDSLAISYDL